MTKAGDRVPLLSDPEAVESYSRFREELRLVEEQTMAGLDLIVSQLDRALESINYQDVELAGMVVADDLKIDGRYLEVHHGVLSLLGSHAPAPDDLRLAAALLHIIRCVERMGDQCVNMAKLVPLSGYEAPKDATILELIERMGQLARQQVVQTKEAFRTRHVSLAKDLARQDADVNRLNREIFQRAVDVGDEPEVREWAMFMTLVARCLERIGDNAVDVAEQTVFVVTGLFREFHRPDVTQGRRAEPAA
jgi:phosphate transport system protein